MPDSEKNEKQTNLLATDIGGTFTDIVWLDDAGTINTKKVPSDPDHSARPVTDLLDQRSSEEHLHGTTIATNAVLERSGGNVAFVTTAGFRDLLFIARQDRPSLYDFDATRTPPLVERDLVFEVTERMAPDGTVLEPLTESDLSRLLEEIRSAEPDAVAVCLLHSYANPEHEKRIEEAIDFLPVSRSSRIHPEFREYQRASTTVMNAYLDPVIQQYIRNMNRDAFSPLSLMKSSGGLGTADTVTERSVELLLSGPAGGAVSAARLGDQLGENDLVNIDIGGTSADISMVIESEPAWTSETTIDGLPIGVPMLDIETIGAGGGSIVRMDQADALQVGPESAGAEPGPICYNRGGNELTVTDAHLMLGHIGTETPLGEQLDLSQERTGEAFEAFCESTELTPGRLAEGILEVVNTRMVRAIRETLVRKGQDPEQFSLVAFGGAGPLHACDLAEELSISTIYIPEDPGVFSAMGILQADYTAHQSRTILESYDGMTPNLEKHIDDMKSTVQAELEPATSANQDVQFSVSLDLRYEGQSYELTMPRSDASVDKFHDRHQEMYGYHVPDETIELVHLRVFGSIPGSTLSSEPLEAGEGEPVGTRSFQLDNRADSFPVFKRSHLGAGQRIEGLAVIEESSGTILVRPGWIAEVRTDGVLEIEYEP